MQLLIQPDGGVRCVYGEAIDLATLGRVQIRRGSFVEPDEDGRWFADMARAMGRVWDRPSGAAMRWLPKGGGSVSTGWFLIRLVRVFADRQKLQLPATDEFSDTRF